MPGLSYDLQSYRNYLRISAAKHLLVEGPGDKRVFKLLLDELLHQASSPNMRCNIMIDSADHLLGFGGNPGNRDKVETVCETVSRTPYAKRLVGFVDRDFRHFGQAPYLHDAIGAHKVSDRLVWSRGHSIENYYFDFGTLRNPLRAFSVTHYFSDALSLFEVVFEQAIRLACAASLAGHELGKLRVIKGSVDQGCFQLQSAKGEALAMDLSSWKNSLVKRHCLSTEGAEELIERFQFWDVIVQQSNFCVVRWMCHGHIGLAFIWSAYSYCLLEACRREGCDELEAQAEARRVLQASEGVRFNACAEIWVRRALGNHCCYPVEVLELLEVSAPSTTTQS